MNALRRELPFLRSHRRLIAAFRGVPSDRCGRSLPQPKTFSQILPQIVQRASDAYPPMLQMLQTHWNDWFRGTEFQSIVPERLDRWNVLWVKVSDAIVRQKLQFKSDILLKTLSALLPEKIESVRWVL